MRFVAIIVALFAGACGNQALDISRETLVRTAEVVRATDRAVATQIGQVSDAAAQRAHDRAGECQPEDQECLLGLFRQEMAPYYRLVESLETAREALMTWEAVNDAVAARREPETDWTVAVCQPLQTSLDAILALLSQVGIDVPELVSTGASLAGDACRLGVDLIGDAR